MHRTCSAWTIQCVTGVNHPLASTSAANAPWTDAQSGMQMLQQSLHKLVTVTCTASPLHMCWSVKIGKWVINSHLRYLAISIAPVRPVLLSVASI